MEKATLYFDVNFYRNVVMGKEKEVQLFEQIKKKIAEGKVVVLYSQTHEIELGTLYPRTDEKEEIEKTANKSRLYKAALRKIDELNAIKIKNPPEIIQHQILKISANKNGKASKIIDIEDIIDEFQGRETQPFWFVDPEEKFRALIRKDEGRSKKEIYRELISWANQEQNINFSNEVPVLDIQANAFAKIGSQKRSEEDWKIYKNDFLDVRHVSGSLPYCDILQVDHSMKINLIESGFQEKYSCRIYSLKKDDIYELIKYLEQL